MSEFGSELNPKDEQTVRQILMRQDRQAIWDLADTKVKLPNGESVAKKLLMGNSWNGKLDLSNPEAMESLGTMSNKGARNSGKELFYEDAKRQGMRCGNPRSDSC